MSGKRGCELLLEVGNAAMSKKHKGHWSQGLLASITDQNLVVEEDDLMVIIKDKYPKVANDVSVCCDVAFCVVCVSLHCRTCKMPVARTVPGRSVISATVVCVSLHCRTCKIPVARTAPGRSVISATVGTITAVAIVCSLVPGLFVPMHFRSRERKFQVYARERKPRRNFRSRERKCSRTFAPWTIRSGELSLPR